MIYEVRSQVGELSPWRPTVGAKSESPVKKLTHLTAILANLQKHFAHQSGVARPNYFDN